MTLQLIAPAPAPAIASTQSSAGRRNRIVGATRLTVAVILVAAAVVLLRVFVGQTFVIPSHSMEGTLEVGDRVLVEKVGDFQRGDVVVFSDSGRWLQGGGGDAGRLATVAGLLGGGADTPGFLIKRVIGMPGDHVVCCDSLGRLMVNGEPLDESAYLYTNEDGTTVHPSDVTFDVVVPAGRIFVMGDHRDLSSDSRCHLSDPSATQAQGDAAFVPIDEVTGSAVAVELPVTRATLLTRPSTFAGVPDAVNLPPAAPVINQYGVTC